MPSQKSVGQRAGIQPLERAWPPLPIGSGSVDAFIHDCVSRAKTQAADEAVRPTGGEPSSLQRHSAFDANGELAVLAVAKHAGKNCLNRYRDVMKGRFRPVAAIEAWQSNVSSRLKAGLQKFKFPPRYPTLATANRSSAMMPCLRPKGTGNQLLFAPQSSSPFKQIRQ